LRMAHDDVLYMGRMRRHRRKLARPAHQAHPCV
jgi:hypothetical protein